MARNKIFFEKLQLHPCVSSDGQELRKCDKPMCVNTVLPNLPWDTRLGYASQFPDLKIVAPVGSAKSCRRKIDQVEPAPDQLLLQENAA